MQQEWISGAECEALCRRFAPLGDVDIPEEGLSLDQLSERVGVSPTILRAALTPMRRQTEPEPVAPVEEELHLASPFEVDVDDVPAAFRTQSEPSAPTMIKEVTERSPAEVVGSEGPSLPNDGVDIMNRPLNDAPGDKPAWGTMALVFACAFAVIAVGVLLRAVWIGTAPRQPDAINRTMAGDSLRESRPDPFVSTPPFDRGESSDDSASVSPAEPSEDDASMSAADPAPAPIEEAPAPEQPSSRLSEPLPAPGEDGSGIGSDPAPAPAAQPSDPPPNLPEGPDGPASTPPPSLSDGPQ